MRAFPVNLGLHPAVLLVVFSVTGAGTGAGAGAGTGTGAGAGAGASTGL